MERLDQEEYQWDYEYSDPAYNEAGKLEGMQRQVWDDRVLYEHLYKDGIIQEALNYEVVVNGSTPVKGIYREGKPYSGLFVHTDNSMELYLTNCYEEGTIVAQYSRPLMSMNEEGFVNFVEESYDYEDKGVVLTTKTTYENGKVKDGVQYHFYKMRESTFLLATEYYTQGNRKSVVLLLGAVHYADFLRLNFLQDGFEIVYNGNMDTEGGSITTVLNQGKGSVTLSAETGFEFWHKAITESISPDANSVHYYEEDGRYYYQENSGLHMSPEFYSNQNSNILSMVFECMRTKVPLITQEGTNDYSGFFRNKESADFFTELYLLENAAPYIGTLIGKDVASNTYYYSKYKEGVLFESKKELTAGELKTFANFNSRDFSVRIE